MVAATHWFRGAKGKNHSLSAYFTPAAFTLALTPPVPKFAVPPFRAAFYDTERVRKEQIDNRYL